MKEYLIDLVSGLPPEAGTSLLAMMPVGEVRISIPVAIVKYHMSPLSAVMWSLAGNIIMGIVVAAVFVPMISYFIQHWQWLHKVWTKYIYRIETKNTKAFKKWGSIVLILFVALPVPMTGIFTGAVAASIFQIPFIRAVPLLAIGSTIASMIVMSITILFTSI